MALISITTESNAGFVGRLLQRPKTLATAVTAGASVYGYRNASEKTQNKINKYAAKAGVIGCRSIGATLIFTCSIMSYLDILTFHGTHVPLKWARVPMILGTIVAPAIIIHQARQDLKVIDEYYQKKSSKSN